MADFGEMGGFDANKVEPNANVLPAGDYDVIITDSRWEESRNGGGKYLNLRMQVISGPQQNRVLFDRLNLQHSNPLAVQIAKGNLSAICRAVNVLTPKDSAELHNRPLRVSLSCKNSEQYGMENKITGYKSRHAGAPAPTPANVAPQTGATVASADSAASPW